MNNGRGESGERRESHNVTIQWCSRDQSKTTNLSGLLELTGADCKIVLSMY